MTHPENKAANEAAPKTLSPLVTEHPTPSDDGMRTGGQLLVDVLVAQQVDTIFTVPGESFLAALDALYDVRDRIRLIVCRHEANAAHMAEAHGKLTGRPGICFVTRGPGASHAAIGIHTARQDATPLIVFVGQVGRDCLGREAWQEIDYAQMFSQSTKGVLQVEDPARVPELVGRAFDLASSGRPGPVVVPLPEDMLAQRVDARALRVATRPVPRGPAPLPEDIDRMLTLLSHAQRPIVLLGGGGWTAEACERMAQCIAHWQLPVACSFRRQDLFDNRAPGYAGECGLGMDPALFERVAQADLVLAIGPRLGETSTRGYALFDVPRPKQTLVHVHLDAQELGRVYDADVKINAGMLAFANAWLARSGSAGIAGGDAVARDDGNDGGKATPAPAWRAWTEAAQRGYAGWRATRASAPAAPTSVSASTSGTIAEDGHADHIDLTAVVQHVNEALPTRAIVSNGAGNYTLWVQRFFQYRGWRSQLAPTSGAMGYGIPAAIAARLEDGTRPAVCFAGDGCFLMSAQELATAVQYRAGVIVIVVDNGMYGSIRMHQEKHYPGRVIGTELHNPDFVQLSRAYGAQAEAVQNTAAFPAAFSRALQATQDGIPAVLVLRTDPRILTPQRPAAAAVAATL